MTTLKETLEWLIKNYEPGEVVDLDGLRADIRPDTRDPPAEPYNEDMEDEWVEGGTDVIWSTLIELDIVRPMPGACVFVKKAKALLEAMKKLEEIEYDGPI